MPAVNDSGAAVGMRAFITGIGGFAGSHLAERLGAEGFEVGGLVLSGTGLDNLEPLLAQGGGFRDRLFEGDIRDPWTIREAIRSAQPERVYHLAGIASVRESLDRPSETYAVNLLGTLNVLEATRLEAPEARFLLVSSADAYGRCPEEAQSIGEEQPLSPLTPYGASKAATEILGSQYAAGYGLWVVRVRPFNHIGPRQSPRFVTASLARQLAEIEAGRREPTLQVGDLSARLDFTDVRDVARAYNLVLERGDRNGVYNVCSGKGIEVGEVLQRLVGMVRGPVRIEADPERVRAMDIPTKIGDPGRIRAATGWSPTFDLDTTLRDLLDYWRARVAGRATSGLR